MVIFIGVGIYNQHSVLTTAAELRDMTKNITGYVRDEQWANALDLINDLQQHWNKTQDWWDLFIVHREIESVEMLIAKVTSYIDSQDKESALAELASLDIQFSHIYRNEMFNLQNVL